MKKFFTVLAVSLLAITAAQAAEFAEVDTDENGKITLDEAVAVMPDLTEDAFKAADTDSDGELNPDEFAAMSNQRQTHVQFVRIHTQIEVHSNDVSLGVVVEDEISNA